MAEIRNLVELANRVAANMNLLRPGEELSAARRKKIVDTYHECHAELVDDRLAYWPAEEIPVEVFRRIAWFIAIEVAPAFGMLPIVLNSLSEGSADAAKDKIREHLARHVSKDDDFETMRMEIL